MCPLGDEHCGDPFDSKMALIEDDAGACFKTRIEFGVLTGERQTFIKDNNAL